MATLETELKRVLEMNTADASKNKVKDSFLTILKATESKTSGTKINDLKTLMTEEPKKVIALIRKFALDNDAEKTQRLRRLAVAAGKKPTDTNKELTETELLEILWKVAEGKASEGTKNYDENLNEITSPDNSQNPEVTPWYAKAGYWPAWTGGILVIIGALFYIYWEQISHWWNNGSSEESEEIADEATSEESEKE